MGLPVGSSATAAAVGLAAAVVAGFAFAPLVIGRFLSTRPPEGLLSLPLDDPTRRVRVVTGRHGREVDAFAAGILPGREYVFVTEALVESFEADELAAVLAHEEAHLRFGHLRRRCAAAVALTFAWAAGLATLGPVSGPGTMGATAGFAGALAVVVGGLGVRHEYRSDRYAVRRTGADATLRALGRLEQAAPTPRLPAPLDRLGARALLRRRISRLRSVDR